MASANISNTSTLYSPTIDRRLHSHFVGLSPVWSFAGSVAVSRKAFPFHNRPFVGRIEKEEKATRARRSSSSQLLVWLTTVTILCDFFLARALHKLCDPSFLRRDISYCHRRVNSERRLCSGAADTLPPTFLHYLPLGLLCMHLSAIDSNDNDKIARVFSATRPNPSPHRLRLVFFLVLRPHTFYLNGKYSWTAADYIHSTCMRYHFRHTTIEIM